MSIRTTREGDWEALKAVRLASLRDAPNAFGLTMATACSYTEAQWRDRAGGRTVAEYMLAFRGNEPVGLIGNHVNANAEFNLIAMWVDPTARGSTTATQLVDATKASALSRGHRRVFLDVAPDNARAVNFYRKQGFSFLPLFEPLDSNPSITLQKMIWESTYGKDTA